MSNPPAPAPARIDRSTYIQLGLVLSLISGSVWVGKTWNELEADSARTRQAEAAVAEVRQSVASLDSGMAELAASLDRNLSQINARLEAIERRNRTEWTVDHMGRWTQRASAVIGKELPDPWQVRADMTDATRPD